MAISIKDPIYLAGLNYNIPLKGTWNESLVAGLDLISQEMKKASLTEDIHDIEINRLDELDEFDAQGTIGYIVPVSKAMPQTHSFYIDLVAQGNSGSSENWYEERKYYQELNAALNEYLNTLDEEYALVSSKYFIDVTDDGMVLILRAYFIGKSS